MDSEWKKIREKYNETNDTLKSLGEYGAQKKIYNEVNEGHDCSVSEWGKAKKDYDETCNLAESLSEMERRKEQIEKAKKALNPVGDSIGQGFGFLLFFSIFTPIPLIIAIAFVPLMIMSLFMGEFRAFLLLLLIAVAFFAFVHAAMKN